MLKKIILIIIFVPSLLFAYSINDFSITSNKLTFSIKVKLNQKTSITKNFYDYGVNIFLRNFNLDKIFIKKVNKFIIKFIPLNKNDTLIKIQSLEKFNKNLLEIKNLDKHLLISYGIKKTAPLKKKKDSYQEDKIIEDITKSVFNKSALNPPIKKIIKKKKINNKTLPEFKLEKSDFVSRMIKTYSLLALMCILLIGIGFIFKRLKNRTLIKINNEFFKIIYRQPIAPKKDIAIIKVYDEYLLIGITEYNINLLAKIESDQLKNEIKLIEGEKEKKKFIKYIKEQNEKISSKEKEVDKEYLISSIEKKIKRYRDLIS